MHLKNLLFIGHSSAGSGGAEDDFGRLLRYFHSQKDKYRIYAVFPNGERAQEYAKFCDQYWNIEFAWFPLGSAPIKEYLWYLLKMMKEYKILKKILRDQQIDVCLVNVSVLLTAILISKKSRFKTIVFIRENIQKVAIRRIYQKFISKKADFFFSVSNHIKEEFLQNTGSVNSEVIYSSIEENAGDIRVGLEDFKSRIGNFQFNELSDSKSFKVLLNASFVEIKNHFLLLKSLRILIESSSHIAFKVFFLGSYDPKDKYFSMIQEYIEQYRMNEYCIFLGVHNKSIVYEIYRSVDVVVLTSFSEGLPLVMVESLKMKKPFISTDIPGVNEIIFHEQNGLLVDFDETKLANAILKIASNPDFAASISSKGYATYKRKFNLENNLLKIQSTIEKITTNITFETRKKF